MTADEAIAVQADVLWAHIPDRLHPPPGVWTDAKILSDGHLRVRYEDRWYVLVGNAGQSARTWTATHPNPGALEVVEYVLGVEIARDIVSIPPSDVAG